MNCQRSRFCQTVKGPIHLSTRIVLYMYIPAFMNSGSSFLCIASSVLLSDIELKNALQSARTDKTIRSHVPARKWLTEKDHEHYRTKTITKPLLTERDIMESNNYYAPFIRRQIYRSPSMGRLGVPHDNKAPWLCSGKAGFLPVLK